MIKSQILKLAERAYVLVLRPIDTAELTDPTALKSTDLNVSLMLSLIYRALPFTYSICMDICCIV